MNDDAKNAGRDIMQSRERSQRPVVGKIGGRSECVVGSDVCESCSRVRDGGGGAGGVLGCALALAFGSR